MDLKTSISKYITMPKDKHKIEGVREWSKSDDIDKLYEELKKEHEANKGRSIDN